MLTELVEKKAGGKEIVKCEPYWENQENVIVTSEAQLNDNLKERKLKLMTPNKDIEIENY